MTNLHELGKALVIAGLFLAAFGLLFLIAGKTGTDLAGKLHWLGRLPGDIVIKRKKFTFYFPLATSIIISIVLTFLLWLIGKK